MIDHKNNVRRGAELLDQKRPGWYREIDTERLMLEEDQDCIVGQLFGSYGPGMMKLGGEEVYANDTRYGFNISANMYGYDMIYGVLEFNKLRDAWIMAIERRLEFDGMMDSMMVQELTLA